MSTYLPRGRFLLAALLAVLPGPTATGLGEIPPQKRAAEERPAGVKVGMTAAEVEAMLGRPKRVSRQVLYLRHLEQWTYERGDVAWVEFDWPKGKEARVVRVRAARPGER